MLLQLLPFWILFGILSAYFAHKRGRNPRLWFFIGLFVGLFGFLTLFMLPVINKEKLPEPLLKAPILPLQPQNPSMDKPWFYIDVRKQRQGPLYFSDLWKAWKNGDVNADCLVWCEGMENWKKAQELPELIKEFNS